jgi:hypothetical protein
MDSCSYDPETKQVYLRFANIVVEVDIEDYMSMLYVLNTAKSVIESDPEVSLGVYTDEAGNERQEFVISGEDEEYT